LDETIWSLTSSRVKRIGGSKNFRSSPQKDFFNNIDQLQTYNLADDAAGENKRIVLGSRWLGGTLHAEAGRSCTVRQRLIGVRGRIYDRLGAMPPTLDHFK
jgi:hypothetical protein